MAEEGAMEDEKIATQLWNKFKNQESVFANYSPFVVCLASGTLYPNAFLHCICQDVHFLEAFLNALCGAEECTDEKEEKIAIRALWKSVEERFNSYEVRVSDGALRGLSLEDIKRAGKGLHLQDGCKEFFQKIVKSEKLKSNIHVISYCWCGDLIRSAFSSGDPNVLDALTVHSNELAYERSVSTGEIMRIVESPAEKVQIFSNFFKDCGANSKQLTVYVGGSESDLLCLLKADIGIVMDSSCTILRELGNHFGISFIPLFSGVIKKQKELAAGASPVWKGLQGILYTASSWAEIHAFILGL